MQLSKIVTAAVCFWQLVASLADDFQMESTKLSEPFTRPELPDGWKLRFTGVREDGDRGCFSVQCMHDDADVGDPQDWCWTQWTLDNPARRNLRGLQATNPVGTCRVLGLDLEALNLDVLGLNVALQPVVLVIYAVALNGLLGALLCALTGFPLLSTLIAALTDALTNLGL